MSNITKKQGKDDLNLLQYDYIEPKIGDFINNKKHSKNKYDYPVNIFKKIFFTWTHKVLRAANNNSQLELSHLGNFSKELCPDNFLYEIKKQWNHTIKKTKSYQLIRSILKVNKKQLFLIFFRSLIVAVFDSLNVILYNQIVKNLDKNTEEKAKFPLLTCMILLLVNYFLYTLFFRSMEAYTAIFSYKLIIQLNALVYDKLLRISPYNNISEGILVDFVQSDSENFGEFLTYTPAILVFPLQIIFFLYLLFSFFGFSFFFGIIVLGIIFVIFIKLQKIRDKYQKEIVSKKDKRMRTTTQAFEMIQIVKLYSWEDYFLNKIRNEREEELLYFKKTQTLSLFIDSIKLSMAPFLSFISIFSYNLFNEPMELSKLLTSLFIFNNLTDPLFLVPEYINGIIDSLISLKRIEAFLFSKEYIPSQIIQKKRRNLKLNINKNETKIKESKKDNNKQDILINNDIEILNIKNEEEKEKEMEKEIMIEIDDINFGIIKRGEEIMVIDDNRNDNEEGDIINIKKYEETDTELEVLDNIETNITNIGSKKEKLLNHYQKKEKKKVTIKKKQEKIKDTVIAPLLKGIKLKIKKGDLIGIIGDKNSGKTSLFNAILNNLDILNGQNKKIIVNGSLSYAPQKLWILNDTIRNNIVFNNPYDEEKYNKILRICQLQEYFESLKQNDLTIINDKGDILSKGQKIRIIIARALYSDSDIYLFDDSFSAFNSYIGKNLFTKIIKEYLKGKTILVILDTLQYLPMLDYIIKMNKGEIEYYGNVKDAEKQNIFKDLINLKNKTKSFEDNIINHYNNKKSVTETETDYTESEKLLFTMRNSKKNIFMTKKSNIYKYQKPSKIEILKIVFSYSGGWCILFTILFFNIFWKISDSGSDFIITNWSTYKKEKLFIYYSTAKSISIIFIFIKDYIIVYALTSFNRNIHETLLYRLLRGPINLFHNIVTKSHIINRFSRDIENSVKYFWSLNATLVIILYIINGIVISVFSFWKIIFVIPIVIFLEFYLYNYYLKCAKGLNNLETYTREPILSSIKDTLSGIVSIRAYGYKDTFQLLFHKKLYNFYRVLVYQVGCLSWFGLYIDLLSLCFLFCILFFIWFSQGAIVSGVLGIILNYSLKLIVHSYNFFFKISKNERISTSMESCDAYTHIVQEAPLKLKSDELLIQNNFPKSGKIEFVNYSVRYRPDTKMILKDINILIQPGEKVGIVGRTGSGKSTFCLCLFRIIEATNGQILIDDIDISLIGLSLLRSIITVIPQDPTLIKGSLRENLDPEGKFDDQSMIDCLKSIGMDYILEEEGLNFMVRENGENLSSGERQLICLARAIIKNNKIIIMDEATFNNDNKTELLIQQAIITKLKDTTVITISHRIKNILEYDRILVLDQGKLVEQGNPKELIEKKVGYFYNLYSHSEA
jgi:ATP-binding cassette subfamily C (CFTR/MRP) protein 1